MPRIDPSVIVYRLNVNSASSPIRQKKQVFAPKQDKAIAEEVNVERHTMSNQSTGNTWPRRMQRHHIALNAKETKSQKPCLAWGDPSHS